MLRWLAGFGLLAGLCLSGYWVRGSGSTATLAISQVPLTITTPARPQVVIAVTNSESMDGSTITYCNGTGNSSANCSNGFSTTYTGRGGALLTGSGAVAALSGSASPVNYPVPAGFTPPVSGGSAGSMQPYTSTLSSGKLADNSPSRLNVAKAGILSILNTYLATTDFALLSYQISSTSLNTTWVYYMSPSGGFGFTNTPTATSSTDTVLNPCYGYSSSSSSTVKSNCGSIVTALGASSSTVGGSQYMTVQATSDDASINDVLYSSGLNPVFMTYGTVSPSNPYTYFSLSSYKSGSITVSYSQLAPSSYGGWGTSPTNAGYVPYSPQVLYAQRGWGYGGTQSYSSASTNVAMTNLGTPSASQLTAAYNSFSPYLQPETNSTSTSEIKAAAGQSPIYALMKTAQNAFTSSSSSTGCTPQKYVVLITDGLPTQDKSGNYWPPAGSAAATGYGVTAKFNADGSLNTGGTNDQALLDAISQIQTLAGSGIKTYVIGLGAGVAPATNPTAAQTLTAMAVAGNTGSYYPAVNAAAFSSALSSILVQIQKGSYDQVSVALNSTTLNTNTQAFVASFNPSDTPYSDWTGNLTSYSLSAGSSGISIGTAPNWQAQTQIDAFSSSSGWQNSRLIAAWDGVNKKGVPFEWPSGSAAGINSTQQGQLQPSDTKGNLRLNYLRGDKSQEAQNGGGFRNRSHLLGDIVNSAPVYVGKPDGPYPDSSYQTFVSNNASRTPLIYVGANDGMLHALNASNGNEAFAFVPNGVFGNLYQLTASSYNNNHQYFVDGSPQAGDVMFSDNSWHTVVVGGLGGGGQSIYAMDVTTPANLTSESALASAVLWEFTDSGLGDTYGRPTIARVNASPGFAVFFGNGYASSVNHSILYAVNPQTGAALAKIDLCSSVPAACSSSSPQGLSEVVAVNSSGNSGSAVDMVYAGDLQGNVWAVNVSNANPASWTVRLLFTATDSSGNHQAITTAPATTLNPNFPKQKGLMVYVGTGQLLTQADLSNSNVQAFYGIYDNLSVSSLTPSSLLQQTESLVTTTASGFPVTTVSSTTYNWQSPNPPLSCVVGSTCPTLHGWYYNLSFAGSGTRVVSNPLVYYGNVIYTTFAPSSTACTSGGTSYLMSSGYAAGGPPAQPFLDVNRDGVVNNQDVYNQQPLSGVQLGSFYASSPAVVNANVNGAISASLLLGGNTQGGGPASSQTISGSVGNYTWSGWWQIQ
ncbi:pilus assembly protein [Chromobacterium sp. IIBBL 290-4]|uniref:pilus assembly protein n=1 Tax=Chromobacterium sp. IIBBL 290-4 TaxID=2953890 RepID=UPI0020B64A72|nr:PilC/PilY family type IV pilus protein [Chromobacterium sp. IIBBL 290-4]UTH76167.1 PilC/PilY family type IV pilus protein [Chromobacterium sp. IIBBL 290-4]